MSPISHLMPTDFQTVPHRLIHSVFYDLVLQEEIETAWKIEKQGAVIDLVSISTRLDFHGHEGFPPDEADSLETLRYTFAFLRQV